MGKKYNVPDLGKVLVFLIFFLACTARIVAIVFYFTPSLGIFNVMLPYSIDNQLRTNYSQSVESEIGKETLAEMAAMSWYYLGQQGEPKNVLLVFTFFPIIHLMIMLVLRGKLEAF